MINTDNFNLQLVESQEDVDKKNKKFYGKFRYPWPPLTLESFPENEYGIIMLNQDIGCWKHNRIPGRPRIWVAGCGTNQAVYTALKFQGAKIIGTDISMPSLVVCQSTASQIGIRNLALENKSINDVNYKEEFDYIICTGVIHHNADPIRTLNKLAAALKPDGILELMVYNYCHRFQPTAFQKAVRELCSEGSKMELDKELTITKKLINNFPIENSMADFLSKYKDSPDAKLADALIQPVEYSYTIESLEALSTICNLELLLPCINQFDVEANTLSWNIGFNDAEIDSYYESLSDTRRWQIANLLMFEKSPPFLWFFLQRKDSQYKRRTEKDICDKFLNTKFQKYNTTIKKYIRNDKGIYILSPRTLSSPIPSIPSSELAEKIFASIDPDLFMKDIFHKVQIEPSFRNVNQVRVNLTTSSFPYLKAL